MEVEFQKVGVFLVQDFEKVIFVSNILLSSLNMVILFLSPLVPISVFFSSKTHVQIKSFLCDNATCLFRSRPYLPQTFFVLSGILLHVNCSILYP